MLKKLLKYELKDSFKILSIFYGLALFFGILTRIFLSFKNSLFLYIIGQICLGTTISMMVNILINNLMRMWGRFRQNIYGDESYLTHTLPVKKDTLYLSKFLIGVISLFASVLVIVITLFIAFYSKENIEVIKMILMPNADYKSSIIGVIFIGIFVFYLELINILQCGYFGMILGHRKNNKKIGFSVLYSFLILLISQLIVIVLICLVDILSFDLINILTTNQMVELKIVIIVLSLSSLFYLAAIIGLGYYLSNKFFKKGVDVD